MKSFLTMRDTLMEKGVFTLGLTILNTLRLRLNSLARTLWSAALCVRLLVVRFTAVLMETVRHDISIRIVGGSTGGEFSAQTPSRFFKDYSHFCVRRKSKHDLGYVCTRKKTELESPKLLPRLLLLKGCNIKRKLK